MNIEEIKEWLVQIQNECFLPISDKEDIYVMIEELLHEIDEDTSKINKVKDIVILTKAKYLSQTYSKVKIEFQEKIYCLQKNQTRISGYDWYDLQKNALYDFMMMGKDWKIVEEVK